MSSKILCDRISLDNKKKKRGRQRNITAVITSIIAILSFLVTIVSILGKTIRNVQKMNSDIYELKNRTEEDRKNNSRKFQELFNSRTSTQTALTELTTTVKMMAVSIEKQYSSIEKTSNVMQNQLNELDKKIDLISVQRSKS